MYAEFEQIIKPNLHPKYQPGTNLLQNHKLGRNLNWTFLSHTAFLQQNQAGTISVHTQKSPLFFKHRHFAIFTVMFAIYSVFSDGFCFAIITSIRVGAMTWLYNIHISYIVRNAN